MSSPRKRSPQQSSPRVALPKDRPTHRVALSDLHFDNHNPRFGPDSGDQKNEGKILDRIVEKHGVGDLLSSLAVNGYSDAEPLIGLRLKDGRIVIKEGNRRLAACLIITGDNRAKNQQKRTDRYSSLWEEYGKQTIDPVPVILFEEHESNLILPYLGVKHIVGAEEWSAWAKAAWANELINKHGVALDQAMAMIGDEQRQLPRWLGSYYFIQQLIDEGRFNPKDSDKKGGGGSEFPFSLIYNALGYSNIKVWVGFNNESDPRHNPIPPDKLDAATDFVDFICGNTSKGVEPVASDNRQFKLLNRVAGDKESLFLLKQGESLEKVARRLEPVEDQLMEGLLTVQRSLEELLPLAAGTDMSHEERLTILPSARSVALLANKLYRHLQESSAELELPLFEETNEAKEPKGKKK